MALLFCGSAQAKDIAVDIKAGPLDMALLTLARQSGADIASTEPALNSITAKRVSGRMSVRRALDRLIAGTGFVVIPVGETSFRVVKAPQRKPGVIVVSSSSNPAEPVIEDVIVTGTKQRIGLLRFAGSVQFVGRPFLPSGADRAPSMDDVARMTPILEKTELGVGRNKLFIRGISDSSFNGPSQSTATVYFGDVPLGYAGADPALNLYDMARVEILEGPQGTLYGAGAIGGIVRLTPRSVDLTDPEAAVAAGVTATQGAQPGLDLAGMVNLPLVTDKVGLRLVGYRIRDGGFINDEQRGLADVNRTDTVGGRASLRVEPGDGWSIDTGALAQQIEAQDSGYAEVGVGPLSRRSALAQPYTSRIRLARAVVSKSWDDGLQLVSATGITETESEDLFDLSRLFPGPFLTAYHVSNSGLLISQEARLSHSTSRGLSWVAGLMFLYNRDAQSREIGLISAPAEIIGVTNITRSFALFGEATLPLTPHLSVTVGARATAARTDGEPSAKPREEPLQQGRMTQRLAPTVAVSWLLGPDLAAFARFQSGYRTGGIAVARGIGHVADFLPDSIFVGEVGLRRERSGPKGLAFSSSLSFAHWSSIQADLFSRRGQPYTDNIGDAQIAVLESAGDWVPFQGLRMTFATLYTWNETRGVLATSSSDSNRRLPETPPFSGSVGLEYQWAPQPGQRIELGTTLRYVGRSVLGTGDFLDISQGRYVNLNMGATWTRGRVQMSISADNVLNARDALFAMGNPVSYAFRDQVVPLRPRNLRIGVATSW